MKKYYITNVVYGDLYLKIFQEQHLKSVLDETNLPSLKEKYETHYMIFTDADTLIKIMDIEDGENIDSFSGEEMIKRLKHPNFKRLAYETKLKFIILDWAREDHSRFDMRYSVLMQVFKESVRLAHEADALLTAWVADLVVAKDFFPRILMRIEDGHDATFVLPLRGAFEAAAKYLNQINSALPAQRLFEIAYTNLHPLWVACEWVNKRFTRLPFAILWSTPTGTMARSFSVTPIVFKPQIEMLNTRGMIDGDIPSFFKNPYWCENWTDAPVVGIEPLFCYYPTFRNFPSSAKWVRLWSKQSLHPTQIKYAKKRLYYPDKKTARISWMQKLSSDRIIRKITR